ncbi:MAG: serine/threonine protein kinase [Planctomycetes bacterium]|nr:serine/threonine protein kinase [Planctomycetota bacterium]
MRGPLSSSSTDARKSGRKQRRDVPGFDIVAELGHGRTGVVYRARDHADDTMVALKIYRRRYAWTTAQTSNHREIVRQLGALDERDLVGVRGWGEIGDTTWIAMPLIEGQTLAGRITWARGRIAGGRNCHYLEFGKRSRSQRETHRIGVDRRARGAALVRLLSFFADLARIVATGHAAGLVHGDLRPQNVMVGTDGAPMILDWGLATSIGAASGTQKREALWNTSYFAPEQLAQPGGAPDAAADLWAIGVMLYESLTLQLPQSAPTRVQLHDQIRNRPAPNPRQLQPALPRTVANLVTRCLALDPAHRPSTAIELSKALRRLQDRLQSNADATPWLRLPWSPRPS